MIVGALLLVSKIITISKNKWLLSIESICSNVLSLQFSTY